MNQPGVGHGHHMFTLAATETHRRYGGGGVGQQPFPKCCIDPGPDHHRRSVVRTDAGFMGFDDAVERGRIDLTLLGQQCFQRPHTQVHFTEVRMFVAVLRFHISNSGAYHRHLTSNG